MLEMEIHKVNKSLARISNEMKAVNLHLKRIDEGKDVIHRLGQIWLEWNVT